MQFQCDPGTLKKFVDFSREQLASGDWDPAYRVLRQLIRHMELDENDATNLVLLYVAYYNLPSALKAFGHLRNDHISLWPGPWANLPTGIERRGNRALPAIIAHLESLKEYTEDFSRAEQWLLGGHGDPRLANPEWNKVQANYQLAWNAGRWSAYKLAELLQKVLDWNMEATDMGNQGSTAPRRGLARLYGELPGESSEVIAQLDAQGAHLLEFLKSELGDDAWALLEPPAFGVPLDIAMVETLCCDFNSLCKDKYYVGHDLDEMWEQIQHPATAEHLRPLLQFARSAAGFPEQYLIEKRNK